jgi:L-histidine N-alpha-methyltransferase
MGETALANGAVARMRGEVRAGLARRQRELPPKYFYDERGSRLFEEITRLPEYYLTRAERSLLEARVPALVSHLLPRTLAELGAGSAVKTHVLLDAMRAAGCVEVYQPIDMSAAFLEETALRLSGEYRGLRVLPVVADFTVDPHPRGELPGPRLVAFLGSTIGNLEPRAALRLLGRIRTRLGAGDRFLLGVDLKKEVARLEAAYNDRTGVTAAFNRNMLHVLNRELGADFDAEAFEHRAFYDAAQERIEMHLVARVRQRVMIPAVGVYAFRPGESIRTEISCKYDRARIDALFSAAGLALEAWWPDADGLFALALGAPR